MGYESGLPASGTITQREHDKVSDYEGQKRVDLWGFDGANWNRAIVDSSGHLLTVSTGGSAGVQYTEGDVDATITGTAILWEDTSDTLRAVSAAKPLPVTVISGGGGGVQYTEGDVDASITGTAILWEDASDTLRPVSAAKPLPVDIITSTTLAVTVGNQVNIQDGGSSITVDDGGITLSVDDGGGNISIDDGGNSITVDNAGTFAVQDSQVLTDNANFTDGTSKLFMAGFIFDETGGTPLTENDAAAARVNDNRAVVCTIEDGTTRGRRATVTAANALKVDGSAVTQPVDTELPAAAALADDMSNPTTPLIGACAMEFDGSTEANYDRVRHSYYQALTGLSGAAGGQAQVDMSECPMSLFSVQEFKSGTVTAYNFTLEGSNDGGNNWFTIVNNTSASGADATVFAVDKPARRFRINMTSSAGAGTIAIHTLACGR